jgi:hypothetical protein
MAATTSPSCAATRSSGRPGASKLSASRCRNYVNCDGAIGNRDLDVVSNGLADLLDDAVGVIEAANAPAVEGAEAIEALRPGSGKGSAR